MYFTGAQNSSVPSFVRRSTPSVGAVDIKKEFEAPSRTATSSYSPRPNEADFPEVDNKKKGKNAEESAKVSGGYISVNQTGSPMSCEDSDTDATADSSDGHEAQRAVHLHDPSNEEVWPPLRRYDPSRPLELPIGPKTAALRRLLSSQPIFADPYDNEAVDWEQKNALFLIQLPSDLSLDSSIYNQQLNLEQHPQQRKISNKLGKLQLMRSGKVRLLTNEGKSYEVSVRYSSNIYHYLCLKFELFLCKGKYRAFRVFLARYHQRRSATTN